MKRRLLPLVFLAAAIAPLLPAEPAPEAKKTPVNFAFDSKPINRSPGDGRFTGYADILEKVTPAVVSIHTAQVGRIRRTRGDMDELLRRLWGIAPEEPEESAPARPEGRFKIPVGLGSGTLVSADGYILTNRHVISGENGQRVDEITVTLQDKREFTAKVIGADPGTDIALIKIEGKSLPVAKMADSAGLRVGDIVFAAGNPLNVGMTVTSGIVSATNRSDLGILGRRGLGENFIQTDASINPGNSGGPLIDVEGRVVGVNTAIVSGNGGNIGIGLAVPTAIARGVIEGLVNEGRVARGYLGLVAEDVSKEVAEKNHLESRAGAEVVHVAKNSPASAGGVRPGDIVKSVAGRGIASWSSLRAEIAQLKPGAQVAVGVVREGGEKNFSVTVGDREAMAKLSAESNPLPGVIFGEITAVSRERHSIPESVEGILVENVDRDCPWFGKIVAGAVITRVNGVAVKSGPEFSANLNSGALNAVTLFKDGKESVFRIRW